MTKLDEARAAVRADKFTDEASCVADLLHRYPLDAQAARVVGDRAVGLVEDMRLRSSDQGLVDQFLHEFGLSSQEGVALLCLAEALLRIPDDFNIDALIADKIPGADWEQHIGQSDSLFVNASTWGLILTGRVVSFGLDSGRGVFTKLVSRVGDTIVREAMEVAMGILGNEFVLGESIEAALQRGSSIRADFFSFDMLGEGARTSAAAERHQSRYLHALGHIAQSTSAQGPRFNSGVSVKLSALHPRVEASQHRTTLPVLVARLTELATLAAEADIGLTIDAEEADRLDLTLEVIEQVRRIPSLAGWSGLGVVIQAFGKRAAAQVEWVAALAAEVNATIPVRLVKGAYWDEEIKRAQQLGYPGFPVFTRKANTDLSYLVCAQRMLDNPGIDCQFASHNAHTLAALMHLVGDPDQVEIQRLHGMGELLFDVARDSYPAFPPVRAYAPVGSHDDLLAYLVRRLLENGANSSFVNRFADAELDAGDIVRDPASIAREYPTSHPELAEPLHVFQPMRSNSLGVDLTDVDVVHAITTSLATPTPGTLPSGTEPNAAENGDSRLWVHNPTTGEPVGQVQLAGDLDAVFERATHAASQWDARPVCERAACLELIADGLEHARTRFMWLLTHEAGKTLADSVAEIREAADFCRFYAAQARELFVAQEQPATVGETNTVVMQGLGTVLCISPWNFPLAIWMGQVSAALLAGNAVVAKPAEQTPLVAAASVELMVNAGLPPDLVQLVHGGAEIGGRLVAHPGVAAVAFTGSLATARVISRGLADRAGAIVPLVAETGGVNVMFADSTALLEQLTDDVLASAFGSAGQRCSALRMLLLQEEIYDDALAMILGAMAELTIGKPWDEATDVGPLIDQDAVKAIKAHIDRMRASGHTIHSLALPVECGRGTFIAPHVIEVKDPETVSEEHFGPVLHVAPFAIGDLEEMLDRVRRLGFELTMGIETRIDSRADHIFKRSLAGNTYVNRSMIAATVGAQPFGGRGLSGTGPKAGGPHYVARFARERTYTVNTAARGGNVDLLGRISE